MSQDKKYSTSSSFSFVVDPNGAWVPRELSLKRVHVYSYFQFTERMLWDNCITKCIYLFIIFYLKLTYITACLLKQKESEQNGECGSDYSNSCLCFKVPVIWYIYLLCFSFLFLSACLWTCSREMAGRSCLVTLKKKRKKKRERIPTWSFYHYNLHLWFIVQSVGSNMKAHAKPVSVNFQCVPQVMSIPVL